ncbi:MAG: hypothetical protein ABIQ60_06295 [Burkholderiaceae bacterium]
MRIYRGEIVSALVAISKMSTQVQQRSDQDDSRPQRNRPDDPGTACNQMAQERDARQKQEWQWIEFHISIFSDRSREVAKWICETRVG